MSYVDELNEAITALLEENQELRDERDRARATAVALENQLAEIESEVGRIALGYERADSEDFSGESVAALDAAQRCMDAVDRAADPLVRDLAEKEETDADPS